MKILLLNYEYPPVGGGGGYVSHNIAKGLVKKGHEITVVTATFKDLPKKEKKEGIQIYRVPSMRKQMDRTTSVEMLSYVILAFIFLLILKIWRRRFDVAHIHFALPTGLLGPWTKFLFGIDYMVTIHGTDMPGNDTTRFTHSHEVSKPFLMFALGYAARISVVTPKLRELALKVVDREDIVVLPNGVNTELFYPREGVERQNAVLFSGRLIPIKSPEFIVAAFPAILKQVPDAKLIIAGHGYLQEPLEAFVEKWGIQDKVKFVGWVDHQKLPEFYSSGKVFLSLQKHENFGSLAMMEAMACGLPVVASQAGSTEEQIKNGENGFVVPLNDRRSFVSRVVQLLRDDDLRNSMGQQGRESILAAYSWASIVDRYEKELEELAARKKWWSLRGSK